MGSKRAALLGMAAALLFAGCREGCNEEPAPAPNASPAAPASSTQPSASVVTGSPIMTIPGWYVVASTTSTDAAGPNQRGAGWWFSADSIRIVWPDGRETRVVKAMQPSGDVTRFMVEGATYELTRAKFGIQIKLSDTERLLIADATADQARAFEKLDAQLVAKSGDVCARAKTCCAAAVKTKLATTEDCAAIDATPELSRCTRLLERVRADAAKANQTMPECAPDSAPP